ncbi:Ataxin-1 [Eumeta japonica]|uniref:Ataxin-1 n=1 Tax=Eumeta variegata TaxID=151549 RepID=A0A4C1WK47_EUMVA|nr:Ataxin-1 [Eumeta japonica]
MRLCSLHYQCPPGPPPPRRRNVEALTERRADRQDGSRSASSATYLRRITLLQRTYYVLGRPHADVTARGRADAKTIRSIVLRSTWLDSQPVPRARSHTRVSLFFTSCLISLYISVSTVHPMISASLPGEALAQLGQLSHLYPHTHATAPPPPSMTPEFLAPPPRPYARYAPRPRAHPHPRDLPPPAPAPVPPSAAPAFPPVPGAYARFLSHPVSYAPYLYRPPAPAPAPVQSVPVPTASAYPLRPRPTSGFVPPAPAPRSPPTSASTPVTATVQSGRTAPEPAPADRSASTSTPAPHFCRGALIRLEDGTLRRVEDMRTEDFVASAERCGDLTLTHCTLLKLEERAEQLSLTLAYDGNRSQVELESTVEHPFFVYGRGWASCSPERTQLRYGLRVRRLQVGDVCVSLIPRRPSSSPAQPPAPPPPQTHPENLSVKEDAHKRRWSASDICDDDRPPHKKR